MLYSQSQLISMDNYFTLEEDFLQTSVQILESVDWRGEKEKRIALSRIFFISSETYPKKVSNWLGVNSMLLFVIRIINVSKGEKQNEIEIFAINSFFFSQYWFKIESLRENLNRIQSIESNFLSKVFHHREWILNKSPKNRPKNSR